MAAFKLHVSHCIIASTGFAHGQDVWCGRRLKPYDGPTIELTITLPHDPPRSFNVPFPVSRTRLKKLLARHSGLLTNTELKLVHDSIEEFAIYVAYEHSAFKPYRPFPHGAIDCIVTLKGMSASATVDEVDADEFVDSWFP